MSAIHRKKFYPRPARRDRDQGEVVVAFVIQKSGSLENIRVTRSSGFESLDQAALKTLQRLNPFRPLPEELNKQQWALAVPISFTLKD